MFLIAILSFLSTLSFRKHLVTKGYCSNKLWIRPIPIGVIFIAIAQLIQYAPIQNVATLTIVSFILNIVIISFYFSFIAKMWQKIKVLPQLETSNIDNKE